MHISRIKLENYSSFAETDWIELSAGLNVVIGQNNSGKSAFLAAMGPSLPDRPHREEGGYLPGDLKPPFAYLDLKTSTAELRSRLAETGLIVHIPGSGPSVQDFAQIKGYLDGDHELILKIQCRGGQGFAFREATILPPVTENATYIANVQVINGQLEVSGNGGGHDDTLSHVFSTGNQPSFFHFAPQRLNIATYQFQSETRLLSDARNLPAVLAYLAGNRPAIFQEIESRVREIVPGVSNITISPEDNNFKIILWPSSESRIRELAFDLDHSGTGVAQAIAIMTAVITSGPSVIAIDEINSFLHPSAVKQLLQICTTFYPQHQYIVSTHSADVISFHDIDRMYLIDKEGFRSKARVVDRADLTQVRLAFRTLGISMADVLGADRLVWVEGPTEELVFMDLLARANVQIPEGLTFAAVASTGDFTRRGSSRKVVIDLYDAATSAVAPLVGRASFILDREKLSDDAVAAIEGQTDNRLRLLPRRCIECYAIEPSLIAALINEELGEDNTTEADVVAAIEELSGDHKYGGVSKWNGDISNVEWLVKVDAANLIKDAIAKLTANRLAFEKTTHTPRILAKAPLEKLQDVVELIQAACQAAAG